MFLLRTVQPLPAPALTWVEGPADHAGHDDEEHGQDLQVAAQHGASLGVGQTLGGERPLHNDLKGTSGGHRWALTWSLPVPLRWSQNRSQPSASRCPVSRREPPQFRWAGPAWLGHHLVGAPAPGGQHREPENEARPGDVPAHRVPKHVEGVRPGEVAGGVGDCGIGDGLPVPLLQARVPAHLLKACGGRPQ